MKYYAKLTGIHDLERPLIRYGQSPEPLRDWAKEILKTHPHGQVEIWEYVEALRETIKPEPKEKTKA